MKLSAQRIQELQSILRVEFGLSISTDEAQRVGLAIVRFVVAKHERARGEISGVIEQHSAEYGKIEAGRATAERK